MLNYGHPHKEPCSQLQHRSGKTLCACDDTLEILLQSFAPQMTYKQHLVMFIWGSACSLSGQQGKIPQIHRPLTSYTSYPWGPDGVSVGLPSLSPPSLSLGQRISLPATAAMLTLSSPNFNEEKRFLYICLWKILHVIPKSEMWWSPFWKCFQLSWVSFLPF